MNRLKIYLDNCCYNRPYDDQSQVTINLEALAKLEIQRQIRSDRLDLVASYILTAENASNRFRTKRDDIQSFIDTYTRIYVSEASKKRVIELANEIMASGIKLMDACHVACAVIAECDYFISTDKRLLKYHSPEIQLLNPVDFILKTESKL